MPDGFSHLEFVRERQRREITGLPPTSWRREEQKHPESTPKRYRLTDGTVAWLRHELHEWVARRAGLIGADQAA